MIEHFVQAAGLAFTVKVMVALMCGVLVGNFMGAMPGLAASIGMALLIPGTFGMEPIRGSERFVVNDLLIDGIPFVPALIGLFALSKVFVLLETAHRKIMPIKHIPSASGALKALLPHKVTVIRSSLIGYGVAKNLSPTRDSFGTGNPEGIVVSEAANNAPVSGARPPLLSLGIPGSASAPVLIGGLPIMRAVGLFGARLWVLITRIPRPVIATVAASICMLGACAAANDTFEMKVTAIFGVIGYLLRRCDIHPAPIVLALILGGMLEASLRRAMITATDNFPGVLAQPITAVLLGLAVLVLVSPMPGRRGAR